MYFVYKTTNLITDEYYIGVHKQQKNYDYYLGSGLRLKRGVKKYGKHNFSRIDVHSYDNPSDAFTREKEILSECLSDPKCLNLCEGGLGGAHFQGRTHTEETKQKLRQHSSGRRHSLETRKKISDANRKRSPLSEKSRKKISETRKNQKHTEETKRKIATKIKQYHLNKK